MKQPNCCIFSQLLIIILVINFSPDYQKEKKRDLQRMHALRMSWNTEIKPSNRFSKEGH